MKAVLTNCALHSASPVVLAVASRTKEAKNRRAKVLDTALAREEKRVLKKSATTAKREKTQMVKRRDWFCEGNAHLVFATDFTTVALVVLFACWNVKAKGDK